VGEDRTDAHSIGRGRDRLTIAEAATLLGVHKNTVRNRIKNGSYRAEMVQTERGPTYLIERESLLANSTTNTLSSASQDVVSPQAMEFVQELLRPFVSELGEVREELGAERARRQMAEERAADLEAELEALREEREPPETVEEAPDRAEPRSAAEADQRSTERPQQRSGWRAPVDKLPWWQYVLGLIAVAFASGLFSHPWWGDLLLPSSAAGLDEPNEFLRAFLPWIFPVWAVPGIFGFWVGLKRQDLPIWRHLVPVGGIVAAVMGGAAIVVAGLTYEQPLSAGLIAGIVILGAVPTLIVYVSGALVGRALQRKTASAYPSSAPDAGATPSVRRPSTPGDRWSPRKQALLGFAGTIIAALLSLFAPIISAIVANGG
jgi:excisionase family DNA binding protein